MIEEIISRRCCSAIFEDFSARRMSRRSAALYIEALFDKRVTDAGSAEFGHGDVVFVGQIQQSVKILSIILERYSSHQTPVISCRAFRPAPVSVSESVLAPAAIFSASSAFCCICCCC